MFYATKKELNELESCAPHNLSISKGYEHGIIWDAIGGGFENYSELEVMKFDK